MSTFACARKGRVVTFSECQEGFVEANAVPLAESRHTADPCFACPDGCRYRTALKLRQVPSARVVRDELRSFHVIPHNTHARDLVFTVDNYLLVEEFGAL